jgi:hypothetical protein
MLHKIRHRKLVPTVLSTLIVLGLWSNALAAAFCPHIMGRSDCCLMQKVSRHSHHGTESGTSVHEHMDHAQMSDMNMQDMPMDLAEMQTDDATSQLASDPVSDGPVQQVGSLEAVILPSELCSHCMMHSPTGPNFPLRVAGQSSASYQLIAADTSSTIVKSVPSCLTFLTLHDHGPPGSSAPLYVLVSAFRI